MSTEHVFTKDKLSEWVSPDDAEYLLNLQNNHFKKPLILHFKGDGANGKTTLSSLLKSKLPAVERMTDINESDLRSFRKYFAVYKFYNIIIVESNSALSTEAIVATLDVDPAQIKLIKFPYTFK